MTIEEILAGESVNVEFKVALPEKSIKYMKSVVAFANGRGGKLVFGIRDEDHAVIGIESASIFKTMDAITNAIYDSCEPVIVPDVTLQTINDKTIIIVEVPKGMQKPYYIKSMGILDGVYVRISGTTRHADRYLLQELILEGTNLSFDQQLSDKEVTDEQVQEFCDKLYAHALEMCNSSEMRETIHPVSKNQLITWRLLREKDNKLIPSNGYLLLNGDDTVFPYAMIQCAVFKGNTRDIFITKKEFAGPIYQQIEDAYQFVLQNIRLGSRIDGIYRQDIYELPIRSIRELIANSVCHRSYLHPSNIQVALYDDRLEVTSPGMLDEELTIALMKEGQSKLRNRGIAAAFSYMKVIEAWGSGIPRVIREAKEYGLPEPEFIEMGYDFRINLYRREPVFDTQGVVYPSRFYDINDNIIRETFSKINNAGSVPDNAGSVPDNTGSMPEINYEKSLTKQQKEIMRYVEEHGSVSTIEAANLLLVKPRRARIILNEIIAAGYLKKQGSARHTIYEKVKRS